MKSLLFTFDNAESRANFIKIISDTFKLSDANKDPSDIQIFIQKALDTAQDDPCVVSPEHRHCSVWVSGKKIVEGDFKKMNERFMQECGVHSASVVLKELKANEWCDIRTRRLQ